ncbi:uncharacterized conserved protein, DUF4415 family [Nitrosomonas sp. PY1]|uniref:BrnA antitoxin family protein n=1 Tax=Nitrosomonas sp. PY1 TaxID=1803906 RepID=UPI001FC80915|nr:BrnA antitoxin family protein [Nitrosomonas sp. PY1]GKS68954.1 uncharacterized conserved protein, DUF4415 family [Nitrosomonas sp. PY1]
MPKLKPGTIWPTPEEDAAITAAAMSDPDSLPLTDEEFSKIKRVGRPRAILTKERISIRLSRDVLDAFRSTGIGWQTRMNDALAEWLREHRS